MEFADGFGDFGGAGVLVAVIGEGLPESGYVSVCDDRLVYVDFREADGWVGGRLQPSCDSDCSAGVVEVGAGAGDAGDDGGLEAVDRVGAQAQQAGAVGV